MNFVQTVETAPCIESLIQQVECSHDAIPKDHISKYPTTMHGRVPRQYGSLEQPEVGSELYTRIG